MKLPDRLVIVYPCLSMKLDNYTPSYNVSLEDKMITPKLMISVAEAYVPKNWRQDDPMISPKFISQEWADKLPPISIF